MKLIFGNLKMNFLYKDFSNYLNELVEKLDFEKPKTQLGIAVPYIYLEKAANSLGQKLRIIAQDIHHEASGAFTSCISANQISSMSITWTLIGHSECRSMNQNSETIYKKLLSAFANNLGVIYCCGANPIDEIKSELSKLQKQNLKKLVIAFEPVASIGTGLAMNQITADKQLGEIRSLITDIWGSNADDVKLLYGGSVNLENYKSYLEQTNIDGVLVGGASLMVDTLWKMATLQ